MAAKAKVMSAAEISGFSSQVALILDAGLPLYDGVETLAEASKGSSCEDAYRALSEAVSETGSLHEALSRDERWPRYLVEMVGIGETTGQLERVMNGLAAYYSREDRIRQTIIGAVTYPLVLTVMLLLIIAVMIFKVLPVFQRVLSSMGAEMTATGSAMLGIGSAIGWIALALVGIVLLAVIAGAILLRTKKRGQTLALIRRVFQPMRQISLKLAAARVASVLSMMLKSGFPTGEAFRLLPPVIMDPEAREKVASIGGALENGESLADAIAQSKLFDGLHARMIRMGVAAGREDQVLENVAGIYEEQVENGIGNLISIIEPTLIALLCVVIGAILLSVMLPMAGVLSAML